MVWDPSPPPRVVARRAVCFDGARACPPEDCAGVPGYADLLEALQNRKHPEHKAMKEWLGRPFEGEHFAAKDVNRWLAKLGWTGVTEAGLRKVLLARDGVG